MTLIFPCKTKKYVDLQCNGDYSLYETMPDAAPALPYLRGLDPSIAVDIGAGIGRASVWFHVKFKWNRCTFHFVDGDGGNKQMDGIRSGNREYYNSWEAAGAFVAANNLHDVVFWNPEEPWDTQIKNADVCYSFLAIGFHWPMNAYIPKIHRVLRDKGLAIFGTRGTEADDWVIDQRNKIPKALFRIVLEERKPTKDRSSILILEKRT